MRERASWLGDPEFYTIEAPRSPAAAGRGMRSLLRLNVHSGR